MVQNVLLNNNMSVNSLAKFAFIKYCIYSRNYGIIYFASSNQVTVARWSGGTISSLWAGV